MPRSTDLFAISLISYGAKAVAQIILESTLKFASISQQLDTVADKKAGLEIAFPESVLDDLSAMSVQLTILEKALQNRNDSVRDINAFAFPDICSAHNLAGINSFRLFDHSEFEFGLVFGVCGLSVFEVEWVHLAKERTMLFVEAV